VLIRGQKILVQYLPESVAEIDDQVSSVTRIAVAFIGLAALVLEAPKYLLPDPVAGRESRQPEFASVRTRRKMPYGNL